MHAIVIQTSTFYVYVGIWVYMFLELKQMILEFIWKNDHVEITNREGERQRQRQRETETKREGDKEREREGAIKRENTGTEGWK